MRKDRASDAARRHTATGADGRADSRVKLQLHVCRNKQLFLRVTMETIHQSCQTLKTDPETSVEQQVGDGSQPVDGHAETLCRRV